MLTFLLGAVIVGAIVLFWFWFFPNYKKPVAVRSSSEQKLHFEPGQFEIQSRVMRRGTCA